MNLRRSLAPLLFLLPLAAPLRAADRPNVVIIISDEHQAEALGCLGCPNRTVNGESPTPHLDELAARGVNFTNAYTASPVCAPARASLITGVYPHVHTALHHMYNGKGPGYSRFPGILPDMTTIGDAFRKGGYATAAIGKLHVHGEVKGVCDLGFDHSDMRFYTHFPGAHYADFADGDWNKRYREEAPYNGMKYRDIDPERFVDAPPELTPKSNPRNQNFMETLVQKEEQVFDDLVAARASDYIAKVVAEKKPFFAYVGFEKPHAPYSTHRKYMNLFSPEKMVLPATWDQAKKTGRYPFLQSWLTVGDPHESTARCTTAAYYACLREMDEQVGKVIQKCKDLGIYDDTIFVYTSDHGDSMYTHSLIEKHCMFEMASRVPLLISYPKALPSGVKCSGLVSMIDILPTILQLTSQPVPATYQGVPLTATLEGKASSERTVFSEFYEANKGSYKMFPDSKDLPMKMCRYKDFKYVYTHGFIEQLYDLKSDPQEMKNLAVGATASDRAMLEKLRLATLDGWTVDERPLFDVRMRRVGGGIGFAWDPRPETAEYILYRGETADPLKAAEVGRSTAPGITDPAPPVKPSLFYWVVAVPELRRTTPDCKLYEGVPVATETLAATLPASMRMEVKSGDTARTFAYEKQDKYDQSPAGSGPVTPTGGG